MSVSYSSRKLTAAQKRATERWTRSAADAMAVAHGCWFDTVAAGRVVTFFETFLRHSKGEWAGQPFKLLPFQRDEIIKPLFGWMRADGTRRYRTAYIEVPKKNGKSSLCSGLALYGLLGDGEEGAEVYSAAASRDQAAIVYREAVNMVKASPGLYKRLTLLESQKHMTDVASRSLYKALSAEAGTNEGMNISMLIMDEMHAQPNDKFWNALMYGGAARRQPLQVIITTAGVDPESLCYEYHTKAMQVMEGSVQDDGFFAYVRTAEWAMRRVEEDAAKEACWKDEAVWHEANPALGSVISLESFREDFQRAVQSPRLENAFKRYRLNIWTAQVERWLSMDHWLACGERLTEADLHGQPCWAGLDLATTSDLCGLVLYFPTCGNAVLPYAWVPRDTVTMLEVKGDPLYAMWERQGYLRVTEGNVTDYDCIKHDIRELSQRFDIREIGIDPWNSTQMQTQLMAEGYEIVQYRQGFASMNAPSKELERLILSHEIRHGNHPVLTWCVGNVAVQKDPADNLKPSKALSKKKIDLVVALVMALGRAMVRPEDGSVYDSRGIITVL
jgi:phage terminase large subunit-like protein